MEQWRPVVGYEGYYEVSDLGNVRSLDRVIEMNNRWGTKTKVNHFGVQRKLHKHEFGYPIISLRKDNHVDTRCVHSLILETFVGQRPNGMECRHLDGNPQNSVLKNLAWGTFKENKQDTVRHGHSLRGAKNPMAKLKAWQIRLIRKCLDSGTYTRKQIASIFGTTVSNIRNIALETSWGWL